MTAPPPNPAASTTAQARETPDIAEMSALLACMLMRRLAYLFVILHRCFSSRTGIVVSTEALIHLGTRSWIVDC
jgi:hypothetical protein